MKIIKNNKNYGGSAGDRKFFEECYNEIKPLKKITVFFNYQNFLLSDYNTEIGTTFVAESWNGTQIHLTGLNCGYGGTGPNETAKTFRFLGIDYNLALDLIWAPGLEIKFDKDGNVIYHSIVKKAFFTNQGEHNKECQVYMDEFSYVDFNEKKLYFINPQYHHPRDMYNAIDKIKPYKLQYYIGNDSPLDYGYLPDYKLVPKAFKKKDKITGVNLILYGRYFNILFLIDSDTSRSFINMIHNYIFQTPLFDDNKYIMKPPSKLKSYLFHLLTNPSDSTHGTINIDLKREVKL